MSIQSNIKLLVCSEWPIQLFEHIKLPQHSTTMKFQLLSFPLEICTIHHTPYIKYELNRRALFTLLNVARSCYPLILTYIININYEHSKIKFPPNKLAQWCICSIVTIGEMFLSSMSTATQTNGWKMWKLRSGFLLLWRSSGLFVNIVHNLPRLDRKLIFLNFYMALE